MENYSIYLTEFTIIAIAHLLAVASPGPDFAVVMKHSVSYGRRTAIVTSMGVGLAILIHVTYCLVGLGVMIQTTPWLFDILKFVGAAYISYIGLQAIRSSAPDKDDNVDDTRNDHSTNTISDKKAFFVGFLTNGLNPKATLFFLSLFVVVISSNTPNSVKAVYGIYMAIATAIWFSSLSLVLSHKSVRQYLLQKGYFFDRVMGLLLLGLATKLVFSDLAV